VKDVSLGQNIALLSQYDETITELISDVIQMQMRVNETANVYVSLVAEELYLVV